MDDRAAPLRMKSLWLIAFVVVGLVHLIFVAIHVPVGSLITTWLLAPLLAVWVWQAGGSWVLILALLLCWVGDMLGNPRAIGLGPSALMFSVAAYVGATVCFFVSLIRVGAVRALRDVIQGRRWWMLGVTMLYVAVAAGVLVVAWGSLGPAFRAVAAAYFVLLIALAVTALALEGRTGAGAALFLLTELLVALEIAGRLDGTSTLFKLVTPTTYLLGILLISIGSVSRRRHRQRHFVLRQ
jgi:hypothetical protein